MRERYDAFVLRSYFVVKGDPATLYASMVAHLADGLQPVSMSDIAWQKDPMKLRDEMVQSCNQNCGISLDIIESMPVDGPWTELLSKDERNNYAAYLKNLEMDSLPAHERGVRGVAVSQDAIEYNMSGSFEQLPSFTRESTKRIMLTHLDRWLTVDEKLALTGFPVHEDQGGVLKIFGRDPAISSI